MPNLSLTTFLNLEDFLATSSVKKGCFIKGDPSLSLGNKPFFNISILKSALVSKSSGVFCVAYNALCTEGCSDKPGANFSIAAIAPS